MKMKRIVWQYWEDSDNYPQGIPYIQLCHETVDKYQSYPMDRGIKSFV